MSNTRTFPSFYSFTSFLLYFLLSQYGLLDDQLAELARGETQLRDSLSVYSLPEPQASPGQSLPREDGANQLVGSSPVLLEPTHELNPSTDLVGLLQNPQLEDIELDLFSEIPVLENISSDYDSFLLPSASPSSQTSPLFSGSELDLFQSLDGTCQVPQLGWDLEHLLANC